MDTIDLETFQLDVCPHCKGIWFDASELEESLQIDAAGLSASLGEYLTRIRKPATLDQPPAFCPRCHAPLEAHRFDMGLAVITDVCAKNCGIWLDEGELGSMIDFHRQQMHPEEPGWGPVADVDAEESRRIIEEDERMLRHAGAIGSVAGFFVNVIRVYGRIYYPGFRMRRTSAESYRRLSGGASSSKGKDGRPSD